MTDQEFDRFKEKLLETMTFPSVYMFKLIVPSENRTIALVENLFGEDADSELISFSAAVLNLAVFYPKFKIFC